MTEKEREAFLKLLEVTNKFLQLSLSNRPAWSMEHREMGKLRKELIEVYEV